VIIRSHLENWIPLADARDLVDRFFEDRATYPDSDFYSRKRGINKDIPEEFYPLLLLAEHLPTAKSLRLSSTSLHGPDGAVLLVDESEITVQVTVSYERSDGYKVRQDLRDHGTWSSKGFISTEEVIKQRLKRILDSIKDKEANSGAGKDVLLIVDQSISWGTVIDPGLPDALEAALSKLPPSKYSATYVAYGADVRLVR
jgi:hypothetical protein